METLYPRIVPTSALSKDSINAMYALYEKYYESTNLDIFQRDLSHKNTVLQIYNALNELVGFTTILNYGLSYQSQELQIIYSGDTIMAESVWGNPILAFAWLKYAGSIKACFPTQPLYWFIVVKGHRTYRYLPIFSKAFYPHYQFNTPAWEQGLLNYLANKHFAEYYDPDKGIVHFPQSQGHLRQAISAIPQNLQHRKEIQFFLEKNPQYTLGDELVCLCKLDEANLKPLSKRLFNQGFSQANLKMSSYATID